MAIPVGTTTSQGSYRPKRKKKKETPLAGTAGRGGAQPLGPQPQADASAKVVKAYYGRTGLFPSPEKMLAFTQVAQADPSIVTQEDVNDLFQPWVKDLEDPEDIPIDEFILGPVRDRYRRQVERGKRKAPKWTQEERASLPIAGLSADETRALANTEIHGTKPNADNEADIVAAREWYDPTYGAPGGGTGLKDRIIARQSGAPAGENSTTAGGALKAGAGIPGVLDSSSGLPFVNLGRAEKIRPRDFFYADGEPDLDAIKLHADDVNARAYGGRNPLMNAHVITSAFLRYAGKQRSDLSKDERGEVSSLAAMLDDAYGDAYKKKLSDTFGDDYEKAEWNAALDGRVRQYLVFANLPYALGLALDDPGRADPRGDDPATIGEKQKIAMRNIEIATGGSIKDDDDVYKLLGDLGVVGDPDDPLRVSDQYSELLYDGFSRARKQNWSDLQVVFQYAAEFGPEMLPVKLRETYTAALSGWTPNLKAAEADVGKYLPEIEGRPRAEAEMLYTLITDAADNAPSFGYIDDIIYEGERDEPERIGKGPSRIASTSARAADIIGGDTGYEDLSGRDKQLLYAAVIPAVMDVERAADEEGIWDKYERGKNRVFLSATLLDGLSAQWERAKAGGAFGVADFAVRKYAAALNPILGASEVAARAADADSSAPGAVKGVATVFRDFQRVLSPLASSYGEWSRSWSEAGEEQGRLGGKAYTKRVWEDAGLNWKEHSTWLWISDFTWSVAADSWMDAGVGVAGKAGKWGAVVAGQKWLAPKTARIAADASAKVAAQEAKVSALSAKLGAGIKATGSRGAQLKARRLAPQIATESKVLSGLRGDAAVATRALWYHPVAEGLAKSKQLTVDSLPNGLALKRFFNISERGLGYEAKRDVAKTLDDMALSVDPEETKLLMSHLQELTGTALNPGSAFLGRTMRYQRALSGADRDFTRAIQSGRRFVDAADDPMRPFEQVVHLTSMGMKPGTKVATERGEYWMQKAYRVTHEAANEKDRAYKLHQVWDDMWADWNANFELSGTVANASIRRLQKLGKLNGVPSFSASTVRSRSSFFKKYREVLAAAKGRSLGGARPGHSRSYNPKIEEDALTGEAKVVEGSSVSKVSDTVLAARREHDAAKKALGEARKSGVYGHVRSDAIDAEKSAKAKLASAQMQAAERGVPFIESQLAKDFFAPIDVIEFAAFNSGHWRFRVLSNTGVLRGHGPSVHRLTGIVRTLALARAGFSIVAIGSDEFWRLISEGTLQRSAAHVRGRYKSAKELATMGAFDRMDGNLITDIMRGQDDWGYVLPDDSDYHVWLAGEAKQLSKDPMIRDFLRFERLAGESDAGLIKRFKASLVDEALADTQRGGELRQFLEQTHRLRDGTYRTTRELSDARDAYRVRMTEAEDTLTEHTASLDRITEERKGLKESLWGKRGTSPKPTKRYTASWLRHEHPDETEVSASLSGGEVDDLLRERADILSHNGYDEAYDVGPTDIDTPVTDRDLLAYIRSEGGIKRNTDFWDSHLRASENRRAWRGLDRVNGGVPMDELAKRIRDAYPQFEITDMNSLWDWLQRADAKGSRGRVTGDLDEAMARLNELDARLQSGDTRALTDNEVLSAFHFDLAGKTGKARLAAAWEDAVAARLGKTDDLGRLRATRDELSRHQELRRGAKSGLDSLRHDAAPTVGAISDLDRWSGEVAEKLTFWMSDDTLKEAVASGSKLKKKDVRGAVERLRERGIEPPPVVSAKANIRQTAGYVPGLSEFAEMPGIGPYWILDKASNALRRIAMVDKFSLEYDRLMAAGWRDSAAAQRALVTAEDFADRILYVHNRSAFETLTEDLVLFQPAYRQFAAYWLPKLAQHPVVGAGLSERLSQEYPIMRVGDYRQPIPFMPFWLMGDVADAGIPGAGPMIVAPLRIANYATGWDKQDDGTYKYTGATDLDFIGEKMPLLSFMGKNTSPLMGVDDLFYGLGGDTWMPGMNAGEAKGVFSVGLQSFAMSIWRDPMKRRVLANNVLRAQVSRGINPDLPGAFDEMRKHPWWWQLFSWADHPEALFSAATRQFGPSRMVYDPADLEGNPTTGKPIWQKLVGDEPQTMAEADYEYMDAYNKGDQKRMDAVIESSPLFAAKQKFYTLDAAERGELLEKIPQLYPYVTSRSNYDANGRMLIGGEYFRARANEAITAKSADEYLATVKKLYDSGQWDKVLRKVQEDTTTALDKARKGIIRIIDKLAVNPAHRENLLRSYTSYEKGWTTAIAGDRYEPSEEVPPGWLTNAMGNRPRDQWDPQIISAREKALMETVFTQTSLPVTLESTAKVQGLRKGDADKYGIEGYYSDSSVWDRNLRDNLGGMQRVADTLKKMVLPKYRNLFDTGQSISRVDIAEINKRNEGYNDYLRKKAATGEWFMVPNPGEVLRRQGVPVDVRAVNALGFRLNAVYYITQAKQVGLDSWDDKYKVNRAWYIKQRDALINKSESGRFFRDGPAGRLIYTDLVSPSPNIKGNGNYARFVAAAMQKKAPDVTALVGKYQTSGDGDKERKKRAATAWLSLLSTAVLYRAAMKRVWNEDMEAPGISPDSNAGEPYVKRLRDLAHSWSRDDDRFRKQYEKLGGDGMLQTWLDVQY